MLSPGRGPGHGRAGGSAPGGAPGTRWIGTSFKMTKTRAEAVAYAARLREALGPELAERAPGVRPFVIPPATAITAVVSALGEDSPVLVGAQNAHWEDYGAWTGELSVPQVADAGVGLVELGHSERREHFAETDATVRLKVAATLRHGLRPLLCVGENAGVRARGGSVAHVRAQADAALDGLTEDELRSVLIAYEPIWAIGEGGREPDPADIAPVFSALAERYGAGRCAGLLYGGSVNRYNAAELLRVPEVRGLFVGRGAWRAEDFLALIDLVAEAGQPSGATAPEGVISGR
ncbi:triose-phosphate isomerase [Streptomyces daliensis]|uniref:Triosephosphate isomerase n=1 Tax=Streptomyces daliensis TaxID=299421 RepID=A0A8T4IM86_9ACTN|nr:triose-phosphate isomerase [Streptomyces daliensis]